MSKLSRIFQSSRSQLFQKRLFGEDTKESFLFPHSAWMSTARTNFTADGKLSDRVFADYSIFKGKGALSVCPRLPTFSKLDSGDLKIDRRGSIMLTFRPAIGERKYDSEKKQFFSLSATEVGSFISLSPNESCEFFHDPSMLSSNAGQVRKSLSIKPLGDGIGYFISLRASCFRKGCLGKIRKNLSSFHTPLGCLRLGQILPLMGSYQIEYLQIIPFSRAKGPFLSVQDSQLSSGDLKIDRRGSIMLTFRPAIGERKYDSEKKQFFSLSATEVGSFISLSPNESCEFFHDPSMLSSNAGQVRKSLSIKPLGDGSGYFISLSVVNNILKTNERVTVPVTTAEFAVMREAFSYALPHILGWAAGCTNKIPNSKEESHPMVFPQRMDSEWDR